jgi:alpha-tubulin suppressor-like RCC1 family protein
MGKNLVRKIFTISDSTWTVPAGVTTVKVLGYRTLVKGIAAGSTHSASLGIEVSNSGGDAYCWGLNGSGQVGDNSILPRSSPTLVSGGLKFIQIENRSDYTLAIASTGDAYAWGLNGNRQLGDGTNITRSSPVLVLGGLKWRQITAANEAGAGAGLYNLGISCLGDGYAWGNNNSGEAGNNTSSTLISSPILIVGGLKWRMLLPTVSASYGITTSNDGYAWGLNTVNGQLGVGDVVSRSSPTIIAGGLKWSQIASFGNASNTSNHAVGITTAGDAYAWGRNNQGQLGVGDTVDRSSPVAVLGGLKWSAIYTGTSHSLGITTSGLAYAWGLNGQAQLGNNSLSNTSSPVQVSGGLTWSSFSLSQLPFTLGITTSGDGYGWGQNGNGQLGINSLVTVSSPVAISGGLKWIRLDAGTDFSLGMDSSGVKTYGWGHNNNGQLGVGNTVDRSSPVLISGFTIMNSLQDVLVGESMVLVIPGQTYPISILSNYLALGADTIANGFGQVRIELEYYT